MSALPTTSEGWVGLGWVRWMRVVVVKSIGIQIKPTIGLNRIN